MRASCYRSVAWAFSVVALLYGTINTAHAADFPSHWLSIEDDGNTIYIVRKPLTGESCRIDLKIQIDDQDPNLTHDAYSSWHTGGDAVSVDTEILTWINQVTVEVPVVNSIDWDSVPSDPNDPDPGNAIGRCQIAHNPYGTIVNATVYLNRDEYDFYDSGTEGGLRIWNQVIGHEVAHSLGLGHFSSGMVMQPSIQGGYARWSASEFDELNQVFTQNSELANCIDDPGPALFGDVLCHAEASGGATLEIETTMEAGVSELVIKRGEGYWPPYESYIEVGRISLVHPDGGEYMYYDSGGEEWDPYLLECVDAGGAVQNTLSIVCGAPNHQMMYPEGLAANLHLANCGDISYQYWLGVATKTETVRDVVNPITPACDFLVVAYDQFIEEVAPLCDYWDQAGFDVELVSCEGEEVSVDDVRLCIARYNAQRPLEAVLIVGSPASSWIYREFVPTHSTYGDFIYGDLDSDSRLDVPIGRIPARSPSEVSYYVYKELEYHRDTLWGGRKDAAHYSISQVFVVPDTHYGDSSDWSAAQYIVQNSKEELQTLIGDEIGADRVLTSDSTDLPEWATGPEIEYHRALRQSLDNSMATGFHAVFGLSMHNSVGSLFGCISGQDWQSQGMYIPGQPGGRNAETFWFVPNCYGAYLYCNQLYSTHDPDYIQSHRFPPYELFANRGLIVFGASDLTWHEVGSEVLAEMASLVYSEDSRFERNLSVGRAWLETQNVLYDSGAYPYEKLDGYCILGDPMLYVRDVYGTAVGVEDLPRDNLSAVVSPNPFNGSANMRIRGLRGSSYSVSIYDLRGMLVHSQSSPVVVSEANLVWRGVDGKGRTVASGTYCVVVENEGASIVKRLVYVK